ncbi:MAG: HPF/RaiA family ribosome-associated protein [Acidimicrobiia bacterium]|nr:HPF/RaiA family ribosome-associated protein [Acidimicrobiia bacterium]
MPVPSDASVEVSHKGDVSSGSIDAAVAKVTHVADRCREPVHHVEIRLIVEAPGPQQRPARAEATLDVEGRPVRAHVGAATIDEAVDLLVDRLRRRVQRHEERRHRIAERHRTGDSGPGEWRHGDLRSAEPEYLDVPIDEREVRRQKTFALDPITIDEALFDLGQLGHDFYLFVDEATDGDCVVRHDGDTVELIVAEPSLGGVTSAPDGVRISPVSAPALDVQEAKERLEASGERHVVFRSPDSGRGQVLYRRFDGHYGLVTPG